MKIDEIINKHTNKIKTLVFLENTEENKKVIKLIKDWIFEYENEFIKQNVKVKLEVVLTKETGEVTYYFSKMAVFDNDDLNNTLINIEPDLNNVLLEELKEKDLDKVKRVVNGESAYKIPIQGAFLNGYEIKRMEKNNEFEQEEVKKVSNELKRKFINYEVIRTNNENYNDDYNLILFGKTGKFIVDELEKENIGKKYYLDENTFIFIPKIFFLPGYLNFVKSPKKALMESNDITGFLYDNKISCKMITDNDIKMILKETVEI